MMDYCKRNGMLPSEIWVWKMAEKAYNESSKTKNEK